MKDGLPAFNRAASGLLGFGFGKSLLCQGGEAPSDLAGGLVAAEVVPNLGAGQSIGRSPERPQEIVRGRVTERITEDEPAGAFGVVPQCERGFQVWPPDLL